MITFTSFPISYWTQVAQKWYHVLQSSTCVLDLWYALHKLYSCRYILLHYLILYHPPVLNIKDFSIWMCHIATLAQPYVMVRRLQKELLYESLACSWSLCVLHGYMCVYLSISGWRILRTKNQSYSYTNYYSSLFTITYACANVAMCGTLHLEKKFFYWLIAKGHHSTLHELWFFFFCIHEKVCIGVLFFFRNKIRDFLKLKLSWQICLISCQI